MAGRTSSLHPALRLCESAASFLRGLPGRFTIPPPLSFAAISGDGAVVRSHEEDASDDGRGGDLVAHFGRPDLPARFEVQDNESPGRSDGDPVARDDRGRMLVTRVERPDFDA